MEGHTIELRRGWCDVARTFGESDARHEGEGAGAEPR